MLVNVNWVKVKKILLSSTNFKSNFFSQGINFRDVQNAENYYYLNL